MPKVLKIIKAPSDILNKPCQRVESFGQNLKKLADQMLATLQAQHDPPGVGLAANQVGVSLQIFVLQKDPSDKPLFVVNPEILRIENKKNESTKEKKELEGCLSIPRIWSPVQRAKKIKIRYQDLKGNTKEQEFKGLNAVIIQHEIDHLQGILFTQRAVQQNKPIYKEEGDEFIEISL